MILDTIDVVVDMAQDVLSSNTENDSSKTTAVCVCRGDTDETHHANHVDHLACLENLCICLECASSEEVDHGIAADGYLSRLLDMYRNTYGLSHDKVRRVQYSIASTYVSQVSSGHDISISIYVCVTHHG